MDIIDKALALATDPGCSMVFLIMPMEFEDFDPRDNSPVLDLFKKRTDELGITAEDFDAETLKITAGYHRCLISWTIAIDPDIPDDCSCRVQYVSEEGGPMRGDDRWLCWPDNLTLWA
jgi:hypothetical protein